MMSARCLLAASADSMPNPARAAGPSVSRMNATPANPRPTIPNPRFEVAPLLGVPGEHVLQLFKEPLALGHVTAVLGGSELAEQLLLPVGQLARDLDQHLDELVAGAVGPAVRQALPAELEDLAVL